MSNTTNTIKHRDTHAGWLGQTRKPKLAAALGVELSTLPTLIMRIEFEQSGMNKEEIEAAVAAGSTFQVKKYQGEMTLFKATKVLNSDPWGINVAGERVTA